MESSTVPPSSKKRSFPGESSPSDAEIPSSGEISKPTTEKESNSDMSNEIHGTDSDVMHLNKKPSVWEKGETSGEAGVMDEELFKKFDIVKDCSDHHFVDYIPSYPEEPSRNWPKRIQKEWQLLEKDLPDMIFVRVYESRIDLMRAVIIGPEGTPYHNGLFCFDILIPAGYPDAEPLVYWRTHGFPLHPGVDINGKVCLLLLNTLHARREEIWSPSSTMLQVLVSIQGLIMVENPYFFIQLRDAETSFPGMVEVRSLRYNEETFIYNVKSMGLTMKNPPKHFEALVAGYYRKHGRHILHSCKAYVHGARVGCPVIGSVQDVNEKESERICSESFKSTLAGTLILLFRGFFRNGVKDIREFFYLTRMTKKDVPRMGGDYPRPPEKGPTNRPVKRF